MSKLQYVTHEINQIIKCNVPRYVIGFNNNTLLSSMEFNTTSGRHEIEAFFGIDFEQEQVDAWETVQNVIDDVMNLWTAPVMRASEAFDPQAKTYGENGNAAEINPLFVDVPQNLSIVRIEDGRLMVDPVFISKTGRLDPPTEAERAAAAKNPSEAINRIERADVESFQNDFQEDKLNAYQRIAVRSAIYPGKGTPFGLMYAALGLAEAGEVQNKIKKAFRDDGIIQFVDEPFRPGDLLVRSAPITQERREQIIKELGGVLWYIAAVCDEIGATMSEVALQNLDELCGRGERNTLRGDGDNR